MMCRSSHAVIRVSASRDTRELRSQLRSKLSSPQGPVGLVAGRDKVGAAGRQNIVDELGVKEEATRVRELKESAKTEHVEQGTEDALHSSLALAELATRALEWDRWSRGELLWHLFEKYQPIFAMRFPSLRLGAAVRAVLSMLLRLLQHVTP